MMGKGNEEGRKPRRSHAALDWFRLAAAFLVIAIHTSPLASFSKEADFFLTRVLARAAVPFFFMVTGQFVLAGLFTGENTGTAGVRRYLKKVGLLYIGAVLLYVPLGIYAGHYKGIGFGKALKMLIFDGTFYHLWYFPACILGTALILLLGRYLSYRRLLLLTVFLYVLALLGDSYFGLTEKLSLLSRIYEAGFKISSYTRNGLLFAPLFLMLGAGYGLSEAGAGYGLPEADAGCGRRKLGTGSGGRDKGLNRGKLLGGLIVFFLLMTAEAFLLRHLGWQRHDSMYISLPFVMVFLYDLLESEKSLELSEPEGESEKALPPASNGSAVSAGYALRTVTTWMYICHPAVIVAVRLGAKVLHLEKLLVKQSLIHYVVVGMISFLFGWVIWKIKELWRHGKSL